MTTETITPEKYEALRRSGQVPAAELPEWIRCGDHGYTVTWMDEIGDRARAERMRAQIEALIGKPCEPCANHGRKGPRSEACKDALSIFSDIRARKKAVATRAASTQIQAPPPPPPRPSGRESRVERAVNAAKEQPFDLSGV